MVSFLIVFIAGRWIGWFKYPENAEYVGKYAEGESHRSLTLRQAFGNDYARDDRAARRRHPERSVAVGLAKR